MTEKKEKTDRKIAELQYQNKLVKSSHTDTPTDLMTGTKEDMERNEREPRTTLLS